MFPSEASASGHLESIQHFNARIREAGGANFWFHALRNCFITVADRELMLPTSLTKRLVNHAPSQDITEGYTAEWTMAQLRDAAQRIADRIDELTRARCRASSREWRAARVRICRRRLSRGSPATAHGSARPKT